MAWLNALSAPENQPAPPGAGETAGAAKAADDSKPVVVETNAGEGAARAVTQAAYPAPRLISGV